MADMSQRLALNVLQEAGNRPAFEAKLAEAVPLHPSEPTLTLAAAVEATEAAADGLQEQVNELQEKLRQAQSELRAARTASTVDPAVATDASSSRAASSCSTHTLVPGTARGIPARLSAA